MLNMFFEKGGKGKRGTHYYNIEGKEERRKEGKKERRPMSLVDENTLIVCLSNKACRDGDKALMEQMKSYGATVAVLGGELGDTFDQIADSGNFPADRIGIYLWQNYSDQFCLLSTQPLRL